MVTENKDDAKAAEKAHPEASKTSTETSIKKNESPSSVETKGSSTQEPPVLNDTVTPAPKPEPKSSAGTGGEKKPPPPKQKPEKQKRSGGALAFLALLVALVALAGVGYEWWLKQQGEQAKDAQQTRLNQSQEQLADRVDSRTQALTRQIEGVASESEAQQRQIAEMQTLLQATHRQIGEVTQVSRRSWMLAEAEYLLRLANQRLLMERDTGSALSLLTSADQILVTVAEPGLFEVREQLAREVAALRAVARLDVEGIFVQLAALGGQVENLALLTPERASDEPVPQVSEVVNEGEQSSGVFSSALEHFSEMVIVRHRDEPLEPLLTPEQHYYVQQNLRLMLEQAQLALLQRKPGVYSHSLEKAQGWVKSYFQLNTNAQALLDALQDLKGVNVNPELPNISASLGLLKAYLTLPAPGEKAQEPEAEAGAIQ
jgi:uroporphyrin-3 C-methyltransferase